MRVPVGINLRADGDNDAGRLEPQCLRRARRRSIAAAPLQNVGAVDAGGVHTDEDLRKSGGRCV